MTDLFEPVREVFTVSRLNREASLLLEEGFGRLWIEGELSGIARPSSGHLYFSLKDERAQVRCAMFRQHNRKLAFSARDGMQVLVRARVSLYEPRGDYQLIVEQMEEAGLGQLQREFEALKVRLAAEGLFDEARKRPLPSLPRRIGVVTSPTGAALHDILTTLRRRFPAIPVLIYPTPVQGRTAAAEIAAALGRASRRAECDVLILARGGGSLEDLWAFNEEVVARAIVACSVPVIAGVGHEVDVTIADFAADLRAPTPTGAAERAVPDAGEWLQRIAALRRRLTQCTARDLSLRGNRLAAARHRLVRVHPGMRLARDAQRLDGLERRLTACIDGRLARLQRRIDELAGRVQRRSPALRLRDMAHRQAQLQRRLRAAMQQLCRMRGQGLAATARALAGVSPLATLERGYAILEREDRRVLRSASEVEVGARVAARLAEGRLELKVTATHSAPISSKSQ
jgi:exodeoxyribonuclease VII large subunit